ncbi:MAG: transposase [Desulfovibrio sp.]|nr:transposase [Desulfovibrio sp.]
MTKLKELLEKNGVSQRKLARELELSPAAVNSIVNQDEWPKRADKKALQATIRKQLRKAGANENKVKHLFRKTRAQIVKPTEKEDDFMLLRKQGLYPETKRHFKLAANPFEEIRGNEDVFLSNEIRYVRESLWHTARHGGFMAVVGESGSGKSTLRRDLCDRIAREGQQVHVMEPYVLGMEDNDKNGKTLKALHIAESIMSTVKPLERILSSPEARFRQVHKTLRESRRSGWSHCLIIEEAHALPIPTIKHLKRFLELEDGFRKLISIVLLGQPELMQKLSESSPEVREVVQRCEVVELAPMNGSLPKFVDFKFERVGATPAEIITTDAVEAIRAKLTGPASRSGAGDSLSLVYPLAVINLLTAAMNLAADIGAPTITPDIIEQV